ncbi:MAG: hypothetical protein WC443_12535 [Desulfobaccales bacterium]
MKFRNITCISVLVLLCALATAALAVEQGFLWDGSHWKDMSPDIKVAYVKGIGNMADLENAAGGSGTAACISKGFVDELKTKTVGQVVAEVDKYYKDNPAKVKTPVITVILERCTKLCAPPAAGKK